MKTEKDNKGLTVILESSYTGHRSGYITHLMKFINSRPDLKGKYLFILNEQMKALLGELATSDNYFIEFLNFTKKHKNTITRSFWEWKIISEVIKKLNSIEEFIFMDIDPYLVLLVSPRFKKFNLPVKGILFQPYEHFKNIKGGFSFFLKKYLKNL